MGWLWGGLSKDPSRELDAGLRDFIKDETNKEREAEHVRHQKEKERQQIAARQAQEAERLAEEARNKPAPLVPAESQFQDGRYAHLWKTYKSPEAVASEVASPQDQLSSLLHTFSDRKAAIGRAAIENCILEQLAQQDCYVNGSYAKLATLCREEGKAFGRCYEMQSRFLKALGYLSQPRSDEEEEKIQMHADKLYHEMLAREQLAKDDTGKITPLIKPEEVVSALGTDSAFIKLREQAASKGEAFKIDDFPADQQKEIREKLKNMSEHERALELQLLAAERRVDNSVLAQFNAIWSEEEIERNKRKEAGKATVSDKLKGAWGWK